MQCGVSHKYLYVTRAFRYLDLFSESRAYALKPLLCINMFNCQLCNVSCFKTLINWSKGSHETDERQRPGTEPLAGRSRLTIRYQSASDGQGASGFWSVYIVPSLQLYISCVERVCGEGVGQMQVWKKIIKRYKGWGALSRNVPFFMPCPCCYPAPCIGYRESGIGFCCIIIIIICLHS